MTPERVILFDGVCNLCNRSVDFLVRHDREGRLHYAPLQSELARGLLQEREGRVDVPQAEADPATIVLVEGAFLYYKSTAALRITRSLGWPWRATVILLVIPRPLRDLVYDWVARNRYDWFGRRDTCRLPTPEERARFLA